MHGEPQVYYEWVPEPPKRGKCCAVSAGTGGSGEKENKGKGNHSRALAILVDDGDTQPGTARQLGKASAECATTAESLDTQRKFAPARRKQEKGTKGTGKARARDGEKGIGIRKEVLEMRDMMTTRKRRMTTMNDLMI